MDPFNWRSHTVGLSVLIISLVFLCVAFFVRYNKESEFIQLQSQVRALRASNHSSEQELIVLNTYSTPFLVNKDRGFIGDARKLNWIESLDAVSKGIGIYDVQFTLANTRKLAEFETSIYHYDIPIYITDMYIELGVLHEADLYLLLNKLLHRSEGQFSVEACEIRRIGESVLVTRYEGLKAKCHFRWFNLEDITKAWAEYEDIDAS